MPSLPSNITRDLLILQGIYLPSLLILQGPRTCAGVAGPAPPRPHPCVRPLPRRAQVVAQRGAAHKTTPHTTSPQRCRFADPPHNRNRAHEPCSLKVVGSVRGCFVLARLGEAWVLECFPTVAARRASSMPLLHGHEANVGRVCGSAEPGVRSRARAQRRVARPRGFLRSWGRTSASTPPRTSSWTNPRCWRSAAARAPRPGCCRVASWPAVRRTPRTTRFGDRPRVVWARDNDRGGCGGGGVGGPRGWGTCSTQKAPCPVSRA